MVGHQRPSMALVDVAGRPLPSRPNNDWFYRLGHEPVLHHTMMMGLIVLCGLMLDLHLSPMTRTSFCLLLHRSARVHSEDAERLLIQPMEIELRKIEGIDEISATASEGFASLFVEFEAQVDLDSALSDVREAVNRGRSEIPSTAEEPFVEELDVDDFPVIQVNLLSRGASERQVYEAALPCGIETVSSVLSADLRETEEMLEVVIDHRLKPSFQRGIDQRPSRNNRPIPAACARAGVASPPAPSVVENAADVLGLPYVPVATPLRWATLLSV